MLVEDFLNLAREYFYSINLTLPLLSLGARNDYKQNSSMQAINKKE